MTQRRTGNYDYDRFLYLLETQEAATRHIYGKQRNGRMVPLTEQQAHEARRDGVPMELDSTRPLVAAEDGE